MLQVNCLQQRKSGMAPTNVGAHNMMLRAFQGGVLGDEKKP